MSTDKTPDSARDVLLKLIFTAPSTCGFEKTAPGYEDAWYAARAYLRATCPDHKVVDGTCENCRTVLTLFKRRKDLVEGLDEELV